MGGLIPIKANDLPAEYRSMLANIESKLPAAERDSGSFYKSHSQFMQVTLDITALTPIRSIKHTLAEVERTRAALQEAYIESAKRQRDLDTCTDDIDRLELEYKIGAVSRYMKGAIRKLNFLLNQHEMLLARIGKDHITEEDYEREEVRYHIMTAMKQALCAARSRGGMIDEGNHIYLFDLGINGAQAQAEVTALLQFEQELLVNGKAPSQQYILDWLGELAERWQNDPVIQARARGFEVFDRQSLALSTEAA